MSRKGLNIYKRKDGRWEARYIKSRTAQGKPLYGYLYASSYHEARNRLQDVIRLQGNAPNSKEMSKGSVFEFFSIEWLDTFSTSFKESTYIRYRTLIRCYLMPYFQTAKIESITKEHVLDFCKEMPGEDYEYRFASKEEYLNSMLTEEQLKDMARGLGVPEDLDVRYIQGERSYWEAGECWEIYVLVCTGNKCIASCSINPDNGEWTRNTAMYDPDHAWEVNC